MRRRAGTQEFDRISWDEALETIVEKLRHFRASDGPQSVLYYTGSGTKGLLNRVGPEFWRLYGGYTTTYGDLCWPAGLEATRLTLGANTHSVPWDIENARLIVLWGKNPAETNVHMVRFVDAALKRGARLIVIDPRRTVSAEHAELLVQPRPGTDGALALGVAHLLVKNGWIDSEFVASHVLGFPEFAAMLSEFPPETAAVTSGVPVAQIHHLAEAIGTVRPVTINAGFGMQRYTNAGQTMRAIIALLAVTGNIGRPGAGWVYANLQSQIFDSVRDPLAFYPPQTPDGIARVSISTARLGPDMLAQKDPPLRMMWIERGNPVTQNPETNTVLRAIRGLEFRVVVDEFLTDTAREADIVLPAKAIFEQSDVIGAYWHSYIQLKQKIVEPPARGEAGDRDLSRVGAAARVLGGGVARQDPRAVRRRSRCVSAREAGALSRFDLGAPRRGSRSRAGHGRGGVQRSHLPDPFRPDRDSLARSGGAMGRRRAAALRGADRGGPRGLAVPAPLHDPQHQERDPLAVSQPRAHPPHRSRSGALDAPFRRGRARNPRRGLGARVQRPRRTAPAGAVRSRSAPGLRLHAERILDPTRGDGELPLLRARNRHGIRRRLSREPRRGRTVSARAFVFDLNRCTGCHACAIACGIENAPDRIDSGGLDWRRIDTYNEARIPGIASFALSLACNHCAEPACLTACPTGAYTKDVVTGAVLIEAGRCIGCRYCTWACPYDAPRFNASTGTVEKCTFCRHRLVDGGVPACVTACPTGALEMGEAGDGDAVTQETVPGFRPTKLRPAIRFVPLREGAVHVEQEKPVEVAAIARSSGRSKITLAGEWTLFVFTSAVLALVAVFAAAQVGGWAVRFGGALAYAGTGLIALALSMWHLGRPERAWRAAANWRTSWLSREVLLVGSFIGLSGTWMLVAAWAAAGHAAAENALGALLPQVLRGAGWAIALLGLAAAFAVDRVYSVILAPSGAVGARRRVLPVGPVLAGSLYLAALAIGPVWLWAPLGVARAYVTLSGRPFAHARGVLPALRIALGFIAAPALRALSDDPAATLGIFALALAGELIERACFYESLVVTTPRLEMEAALRGEEARVTRDTST